MSGGHLGEGGGLLLADAHAVVAAVGEPAAGAEVASRGHGAPDGVKLLALAAQGGDGAQQPGGVGVSWKMASTLACSTTWPA